MPINDEGSASRPAGRAPWIGLLGLNAALLGALAFVTFAPDAAAQRGQAPAGAGRDPGDYTMIAGQVQGQSEDAIYIVDSINREIIAVRWDQSRKTISGIGFRDLAVDAQAAGRTGR